MLLKKKRKGNQKQQKPPHEVSLTRSTPPFLLFLIITFTGLAIFVPTGHASQFPDTTTHYAISGQMCYLDSQFTESFPVTGAMRVTLEPQGFGIVYYDLWYNITHGDTLGVYLDNAETGTLVHRCTVDGNFTLFYAEIPSPDTQPIHTFLETVDAHYLGERYLAVNGMHVRTHFFCYSVAEAQSILRFEWYFEWESGVLLRFYKSITVNFILVQWLDYMVKNTTLSLEGSHPVTAFFANFKENFYAIIGATITVIILFYYLVQKKVQRRDDP